MRNRLATRTLRRMDAEPGFKGGFAEGVVRAFRMRMQQIRAADNENDLRRLKSLRFEKLKGDRAGQYSIRLNDQFRLIFEVEQGDPGNTLVLLEIIDYH